jgi:hypothetical protein
LQVDVSSAAQIITAMRFWVIIVLGGLLAAGCGGASGDKKAGASATSKKGKAAPVMTADYALRGRVAMVNPKTGSVILSFPIGWLPALDRRLNIYRGDAKVGEVRISGPQMDTNIAADLLAGEAKPGDVVREN